MIKIPILKAVENLKRIVVFEYNGKYIAFDPEVPSWVTISKEELHKLDELKNNGVDKGAVSNKEAVKIVSKLLANCLLLDVPTITQNTKNNSQIKPSIYYIKLTNRCNLRCIYCYNSGEDKKWKPLNTELNTKEWIKVIDEIHENDGREIVFTGGEPLLRKDIFTIAEYAKNLGLELALITNGVLLRGNIVDSVANYFKHVTISVDSHIEEINSKTRGKGTLSEILRGIKMCISNGIEVSLNIVITKYNIKTLSETIQFFEDIGVKRHNINLIPMLPLGRAKDHMDVSVSIREIIRKISIDSFKRKTIPNMKSFYFEKIKRRISCGALRTEALIDANGDVYPCRMLEYPNFRLGNIMQTKLSQILHSHKATEFVQKIEVTSLSSCSSCIFRYVCGGGCRGNAFAMYGKIDAVDMYNCEIVKSTFPTFLFFKEFGVEVNLPTNNIRRVM
ncbi:radical SAM protein [Thermococcus prieurii]